MPTNGGNTPINNDATTMPSGAGGQGAGNRPLRLAVTDNDNFALMTMANLLPRIIPNCEVIWSSTSATETITKAADPHSMPDVLILDMSLSSSYTGPDVCRAIRRATPKVRILGITSYSLEHYAADLASAGAQGLVSKSDIPQIQAALRAISQGNTYSSLNNVRFEDATLAYDHISREPSDAKVKLTAHEERILDLLAHGKRYKQIADELGTSDSSIRTGAHRAIKKLGASTLSQGVGIWMLERR
ncbi:response regulator transcription factor [Bifidobacterium sp. ESL0763]|uniref:response regulator n=1 Tax=Bifidobacterium sp. ESL0763 TaxID=2983227 RepID=UPI0023F7B371|nr:response regulator transcription factor [Bifidobacterium sp. ESL0763]MDF7663138.1 response regulator transcription factor [Bifidobacterium sp. ESL0763]